MTNTYPDDAPMDVKMLEEVRCTRCVLERILRAMDEGLFVDYQMEKFGRARFPPEGRNGEGLGVLNWKTDAVYPLSPVEKKLTREELEDILNGKYVDED